jgi:hypothetical protein
MTTLMGYAQPQIQSIAGTVQVCSVASSLIDSLTQIRDGIAALRENFTKLFATVRESQAQISNTARRTASAIGYFRAPQTGLIKPDPTQGGIAGPMLAGHDQLQQQLRREEFAFWQSRLDLAKSGSQAQLRIEQQTYGFLKQLAREAAQVREAAAGAEQRSTDTEYRRRLQLVVTQRKLDELSTVQAIVREQQLLRQKWALDRQSTTERETTAADRPIHRQPDADEVSFQHYITQQNELFRTEAAQWENALKPISDQLAIFATEVIVRAQKISRAFNEMLRSVTQDFLKTSFNSFFASLFGSFGGRSAVAGGSGLGMIGGLLGDAFKGFLGGIGKSAWSGIGPILGIGEDAAEGGVLPRLFWGGIGTGIGNTATDFSSAFGGAAFGGSLLGRMASMLPAAAGGWLVPHFAQGGILSILHPREMVLPAHLSDGLQAAITGGGFGGGHTVNISAVDAAGVARLFRNNGAALIGTLNTAMRNGSILSPAT